MSINDFLVFASSNGSSVMTQANYVTAVASGTGVGVGVADPTLANKSWRQSSIISSVLASYIGQTANVNVIDDGTTSTITSNLSLALQLATYETDTSSTVNVLTANSIVPILTLADGLQVTLRVANTNTGPVTFNYNGLGAYSVIIPTGAALTGGELIQSYNYTLTYMSSVNKWVLTDYQLTSITQLLTDNSNHIATTAWATSKISAAVSSIQTIPSGVILPFSGTSAPSGFLLCPNTFAAAQYLISSYPALYAVCGSLWNNGSTPASGYFTIPWAPSGYPLLYGTAAQVGQQTVGQLLSHTHTYNQASGALNQSGSSTPCYTSQTATQTSAMTPSGGTANKAAGTFATHIVKI